MFFGRYARHGLKPVGVMGGAFINGPVFHGVGHGAGYVEIYACALLGAAFKGLVYVLGQLSRITASLKTMLPKSSDKVLIIDSSL